MPCPVIEVPELCIDSDLPLHETQQISGHRSSGGLVLAHLRSSSGLTPQIWSLMTQPRMPFALILHQTGTQVPSRATTPASA